MEFCNPNISTNCWPQMFTFVSHWDKNLWRNQAKHEECKKTIKHTSVASAAHRQTVGGGCAPIYKICGGGAYELSAAARLAHRFTL